MIDVWGDDGAGARAPECFESADADTTSVAASHTSLYTDASARMLLSVALCGIAHCMTSEALL